MAADKKLPHNTEAEKAVLGAMIRSSSMVSEALAKLTEEDFFEGNEAHRAIFGAMHRLYNRGVAIDTQTITNELINSKELEISGGPEYLLELADSVVTFENFPDHVKMVQDHAVLRNFLKTLSDIEKAIYEADLGLTPNNTGDMIFISIPELTEDRRKELVKQAKGMSEEAKVALRNIRQDAMNDVKKLELSEDEERIAEKEVQDLINKYNKIVEEVLSDKENELMTI